MRSKSKVKGCKHYDNKVMTAHAAGGGTMARLTGMSQIQDNLRQMFADRFPMQMGGFMSGRNRKTPAKPRNIVMNAK